MAAALANRRVLLTGIADDASLALPIACVLRDAGAELVCTGLGPTAHHGPLSSAAARYLESSAATPHLLHPDGCVTGEVRHVDGGYHVLG